MELIQALRLKQMEGIPRVAFVGAGGKTTAIFQCAREWQGPVLVTSTSHLGAKQMDLADRHFYVGDNVFNRLEADLPPGVTLITGSLMSTRPMKG